VAEATARQVDNAPSDNPDWAQGYGYQFWRCRHGCYRGDGAFGQFCLVMPDHDAVLAITSGLGDMQAVLDLVWEHLLPTLGPAPLPADRAAHRELEYKLASLTLPPAQGRATSPLAARLSGRSYEIEMGEGRRAALCFDLADDGCTLTLREGGGEQRLACGSGAWIDGQWIALLDGDVPRPVAASGAWTADDSYLVKLCFTGTSFCPTLTCTFEGDRVTVQFTANVSFGPLERPPWVGRLAQEKAG
jgi:hypothetical protein